MKEELKEKLIKWFYYVNHNKYRKYFEEWYNNLTPQQIKWYKINLSSHLSLV